MLEWMNNVYSDMLEDKKDNKKKKSKQAFETSGIQQNH